MNMTKIAAMTLAGLMSTTVLATNDSNTGTSGDMTDDRMEHDSATDTTMPRDDAGAGTGVGGGADTGSMDGEADGSDTGAGTGGSAGSGSGAAGAAGGSSGTGAGGSGGAGN